MLKALAGVLVLLFLAGCSASQGADGQQASAPGSLAYQGASTGQHQSTFQCDGSGTISVGAQMGSGSLTVTLRDAAGTTAYSRTFSGASQSSDSRGVMGAEGTWTLAAQRSSGSSQFGGGWSGQYGISVQC
jgi:hypothetical protein